MGISSLSFPYTSVSLWAGNIPTGQVCSLSLVALSASHEWLIMCPEWAPDPQHWSDIPVHEYYYFALFTALSVDT